MKNDSCVCLATKSMPNAWLMVRWPSNEKLVWLDWADCRLRQSKSKSQSQSQSSSFERLQRPTSYFRPWLSYPKPDLLTQSRAQIRPIIDSFELNFDWLPPFKCMQLTCMALFCCFFAASVVFWDNNNNVYSQQKLINVRLMIAVPVLEVWCRIF